MEVIFTPYMGLALPSLFTSSSIGTLPQDWALYINSNLVIFDAHDHSASGKQISSVDLQTSQDLDIDGQNLLELNKIVFPTASALPNQQPSLYSNGTDLFFLAGNGNIVQVTALGTIPGNVDGFFGDYAVSGANASYDGPSNTFQFFGAGASQNTIVKALHLSATNLTTDVSTIMTSTMQLNAQKVTLADPNVDFGNSVLTSQPDTTYAIANVVGDGSPYVTNPGGKSLNVPMVNSNQIYLFNAAEVTTPLYGNAQYTGGSQNQETMTFVFESLPIKDRWLPNETAVIDLPMVTLPTNFQIKQSSFNIISAKACVVSTEGTRLSYSNLPIFWRLYVLSINLNPESALSNGSVYFQNLDSVERFFVQGSGIFHYLRLVVKINVNYITPAFFGETS